MCVTGPLCVYVCVRVCVVCNGPLLFSAHHLSLGPHCEKNWQWPPQLPRASCPVPAAPRAVSVQSVAPLGRGGRVGGRHLPLRQRVTEKPALPPHPCLCHPKSLLCVHGCERERVCEPMCVSECMCV